MISVIPLQIFQVNKLRIVIIYTYFSLLFFRKLTVLDLMCKSCINEKSELSFMINLDQ